MMAFQIQLILIYHVAIVYLAATNTAVVNPAAPSGYTGIPPYPRKPESQHYNHFINTDLV